MSGGKIHFVRPFAAKVMRAWHELVISGIFCPLARNFLEQLRNRVLFEQVFLSRPGRIQASIKQ